MKKLKILFGTVILSAGLAGCSSAYYASAGYASDDLYAVHDRAEISRRKQAEAEAQRAAAEDPQGRMGGADRRGGGRGCGE